MPSESRGSYGAPHYEVWEVVWVAGVVYGMVGVPTTPTGIF